MENKLKTRLKAAGQDFKGLFLEWGKYYSLPCNWKLREWLIFGELMLVVVISAYFDEPVRYFFFTLHGPVENKIAGFVHLFGTGRPTLWLFLAFYIVGFAANWKKARDYGIMLVQAYLYPGLITILLKSGVGRWRPFNGHGHLTFSPMITGPNAYLSFPSGDVAVVFGLAIVMASMWDNKIWKAFWIVLAILTSLSRIYYNAHWFSDVIFSTINAGIGAAWVVRSYRRKEAARAS